MGLVTEDRTCKVAVVNRTGRRLSMVAVGHKYSDVYRDSFQWLSAVEPGQTTPAAGPVRYHIGVATTGRDWWLVTWVHAATGEAFHTAPHNYREWLDAPEKVLHGATELAHCVAGGFLVDRILKNASVLAFLSRIGVPETWLPAAVEGGMSLKNACIVLGCVELTRALTNTEATVGFKQHILRDDDAGRTLQIELGPNNAVHLRSHSGVSETVASRFDLARALKL
ncbi:MAG: hypothetical protein J0L57_06920 [Burkholderiales bacterium]|nr:hypothetical protein [Burkholderiales bacterium]